MIAVLLADGFEEIEALTPVDMLRRAGLDVKTVGLNGKIAAGSHKIPVICDVEPSEVNLKEVTLAIFPGGMPGSLGLDASPFTDKIIDAVQKNGNSVFGIPMYGQQLLSAISLAIVLFGIVFVRFVMEKQKIIAK